jgi:hypothetical protein
MAVDLKITSNADRYITKDIQEVSICIHLALLIRVLLQAGFQLVDSIRTKTSKRY